MGAPSVYFRRIESALRHNDPSVSVSAVKDVVADELRALDPTMRIKSTQYFNHSYSPDLIVTWPNESTIPSRFVYIKTGPRLDHVMEDVDPVIDQRPIVFRLGSEDLANAKLLDKARSVARESNTLMTDSEGLEGFISQKGVPFVDLATNALAQGGRGIFDGTAGADAAGRLRRGFEGALAVDAARTQVAADTLDDVLSTKQAGRMSSLLQAVWVGAGGRLEEFPSSTEMHGSRITGEALQFLLQYDEISDSEFWRRVGRHVTIAQLGSVSLPDGSRNLDHFIRANIHTLSARACRVHDSWGELTPSPDASADRSILGWFIEDNSRLIGLRGRTFVALIGPNASDVGRTRIRRDSGISVGQLVRRARFSRITEAEVSSYSSSGRRTLKLISDDRTTLLHDLQSRNPFGDEDNSTVVVKEVGVALSGSLNRVLSCDLQTSVAYRRTNARMSLAELVAQGVPILQDLDDDELAAIAELTYSDDAPGLFNLLNLSGSSAHEPSRPWSAGFSAGDTD